MKLGIVRGSRCCCTSPRSSNLRQPSPTTFGLDAQTSNVSFMNELSVGGGGACAVSIDQFRGMIDGHKGTQDRLETVRAEAMTKIRSGLLRMEKRVQELIQATPELKKSVTTDITHGKLTPNPEDDHGYRYCDDNGIVPPRLVITAFNQQSIVTFAYNPYTDHWFRPFEGYPFESEENAYQFIMHTLAEWVANYSFHLNQRQIQQEKATAYQLEIEQKQQALEDKKREERNDKLIMIGLWLGGVIIFYVILFYGVWSVIKSIISAFDVTS
jgi:hypothetical protein